MRSDQPSRTARKVSLNVLGAGCAGWGGRRPPARDHRVWNEGAATAIVAEGLLMYLYPQDVAALLEQCAEVTGPGSRIAFTYVGKRYDGKADAGSWTWLVPGPCNRRSRVIQPKAGSMSTTRGPYDVEAVYQDGAPFLCAVGLCGVRIDEVSEQDTQVVQAGLLQPRFSC